MGGGHSGDADYVQMPLIDGYYTLEFGGDQSASFGTSYWPGPGERGLPTTFSTNSEFPDPIDPSNGSQMPATPAVDRTGPPIHVVLPTFNEFTGLSVSLRKL